MLTVHHLGISQSDRIVWLCEELGIPYELVRYERDATTRLAPPEYRALHPFGTAPVITDGDVVLGESGAIIEYVCRRHGGGRLLLGPEHRDYAQFLYWFHFANGSMMPAAMSGFVADLAGGGRERPPIVNALCERLDRAYALAERRLGETEFFAGSEFTAADVIMMFPLTTMRLFAPRDIGPYANLRAYLKRIAARPAFQRAMQKADPGLPPKLD
jgi:glutathione S-transferase